MRGPGGRGLRSVLAVLVCALLTGIGDVEGAAPPASALSIEQVRPSPRSDATRRVVVGESLIVPVFSDAEPIELESDPDVIGAAALDAMRFDALAAFPDWNVEFEGPRDGLRALTYPNEKRIEVFVRPSDSVSSIHRVLAHEFGHVVDVELNTPADRDRWALERGFGADVRWWPDESAADFATGAGDFAEAFAVWETGIRSRSTVGDQPDSDDLALLVELST